MRTWRVWPDEDFPRTSTQKPRRNVIQAQVLGNKLGGSLLSSPTPLSELIARITGRSPTNLSASSSLEADLNLSSLERVELLGALEDRYQIDLDENSLGSVGTVGDLERMLQGESVSRVSYHCPAWVQRWPITWIRSIAQFLLLRPAVFLLGRPDVEGRENLSGLNGPALVICNHVSDVDFGLVIAALPKRLGRRLAVATAGETLEALRSPRPDRNVWGGIYARLKWFLAVSLLNLFPLPRQAGFRESFAYAGESADRGYTILVFPEGRHTSDGNLQPFRAGVGLLAKNLRIPVVPMRLYGVFELKERGKKFARAGEIRVKIGPSIVIDPTMEPEAITRELEESVRKL
jgi:long-chain acyl-CoA synthetase